MPTEAVSFSLTAFDNLVKNAIANVTLQPNLRQRQNLPAIDAQGVEAVMRVRTGSISLDGSLAFTDATIDGRDASLALDGNRPPQTPRWAASATLGWSPKPDWYIALTLRHVGAQFEDDQETDRLEPATTLGLFAEVPVTEKLRFVLRGENLTDERIVTRNSRGAIDLGTPRTIWAGLRYGF